MKRPGGLCSAAATVVVAFCTVAALADSEQLEQAKRHFEQREYLAAQQALLSINRDTLSSSDRAEADRLMDRLQEAIQGVNRARQDLSEADRLYSDGQWDQAERLYKNVMGNRYALPEHRTRATEQQQRIANKREMSRAAAPNGARSSSGPPQQQPQQRSSQQTSNAPRDLPPPPPPSQELGRQTLMDEIRQADRLRWQRAIAKMEEATQRAGEAVAQEDFDAAREFANSALQVIEANRTYAQPAEEYDQARQMALDLIDQVEESYNRWSIERAAEQREQIAAAVEERRARLEQQRAEKVAQLFSTAEELQQERRYGDAAEAVRQILFIDPSNSKAQFLLENYENFASLMTQQEINREYDRQVQETLLGAEEVKIPWQQDVLYPKNWLELSARRGDFQNVPIPDEDFELNRILEDIQPEIDLEETPFEKAVGFLAERNDINIAVDWEDLANNGIERDKPISLQLRDVRLRTVVDQLLAQLSADVRLAYRVGDGLLRIATKDKLDRDKFALVYDIRDLIVDIPRFKDAPQVDLALHGGTHDAGHGKSIFGFNPGGPAFDDETEAISRDDAAIRELLDTIRTTVEPASWHETGGGDGSLRELNGQLIVYNTSDAHRQVQNLLGQLREQRALMIAVEARFLTVSSNFLEEIGVDLDFVFNAGSAGFDPAFNAQQAALFDPFTGSPILIPRTLSRLGALPAVPAFGGPVFGQTTPAQPFLQPGLVPGGTGIPPQFNAMTPIPAQQNSINLTDATNLNTGIPGSIAQQANYDPALSIAGSYLDNLQVDFLIRATQANRRSSVVQAPRLMMFNGQRAWVAVRRSRQYVSTVTPTVAEGAVGVQPVTANIDSGTVLDVEGTISADRKYVTLTVRTGLSEEPTFERFEVQRASGNSPGIFILLPDQEIRSLRTTVSVPDGGTVLLGGLKQVGEIEIDAGVPILSKIPVLNRAFTNTTTVKDSQTLLILLKAKILIQSEAEEEAFPMLRTAGGDLPG